MKYFTIIICILYLCITQGLQAEEKYITLNECINIALQNHPNVKVTIEEKKKAMAQYRIARAQRSLMVNAEIKTQQYPKTYDVKQYWYNITGSSSSTGATSLSEYYNIGLSVGINATYSIYDGKKFKTIESAHSALKLSKFQARKVVNEIILNVKQSYYSFLFAIETVKMREKILKSNEEKLKLAKMLFRNGQRPILDVSKAEVGYSEAQLEYQKAKNQERLLKIQLYTSMGIQDKGIDLKLEEFGTLPEIKYSLNDLYKLGEQNYPEVQIIKIQKEINKIKIAIEKRGHYPSVDLFFQASYENGGIDFTNFSENFKNKNWNPSFAGGFTARFPIYSGGMVTAQVDSAKNDYNMTMYKENEVLMNMQSMINNKFISLNELLKQLKMSKLNIANAEKHLLLAQRTYENGESTQLELQDAQVTVINSELGYLKTKFEYLKTMAEISNIVGLGEDTLCKK